MCVRVCACSDSCATVKSRLLQPKKNTPFKSISPSLQSITSTILQFALEICIFFCLCLHWKSLVRACVCLSIESLPEWKMNIPERSNPWHQARARARSAQQHFAPPPALHNDWVRTLGWPCLRVCVCACILAPPPYFFGTIAAMCG